MNTDYAAIGAASTDKARDILRGQMAVRIQTRISDAKGNVTAAVRAYAKRVVDYAKSIKDAAEEAVKRAEKRDAFNQALGSVPGASTNELDAAAAALADDRKEADDAREEDAVAADKAHTASLDAASKRIEGAREDLAHAEENLAKLTAGELKVDAEELRALAQKLVEDHSTSPDVTV